jgi:polyisoprenoid-binding protein YceI
MSAMIFKKLFHVFGMGALLYAVCGSPSTNAAAADDRPAKADQKKMGAPALPAPGTYQIDPLHTFAYFGAQHHVVGLVRGRFDKVTGTITVSPDPAACSVDVTIDALSISTQVAERDEDIRSPAYLDVKAFPAMTYQGRGIHRTSGNSWVMDGTLTLHGVTKVVPLTFVFKGSFSDIPPDKPARVAFHGTAGTRRGDFDMGARDKGEAGPPPAPDVDIQIDVEADAVTKK